MMWRSPRRCRYDLDLPESYALRLPMHARMQCRIAGLAGRYRDRHGVPEAGAYQLGDHRGAESPSEMAAASGKLLADSSASSQRPRRRDSRRCLGRAVKGGGRLSAGPNKLEMMRRLDIGGRQCV